MTAGRHFRDDDTVRLVPPADPWANDGQTMSLPISEPTAAPRRSGRVYGRVYELFTDRPQDGEHPYVGQTVQTIAQRKRGHKTRREVAASPWKANIIDGPRGHRLLHTVYATGDERADQTMLDMAENFWIDKLRPTHNDVRPVRPRHGDSLPVRPVEKSRPVRRAAPARRRRPPWRVYLFLVLFAVGTVASAYVLDLMALPWPWVPPTLGPVAGAAFGWAATMDVLRRGRKLRAWR